MGFRVRSGRRVAALIGVIALGGAAPEGDWTKADNARVMDAANAAADAAPSAPAKAGMMVQLARRFQAQGDTAQARNEAVKAKTAFGSEPDLEAVAPLTDAMALLIKLGDPQAAQGLAEGGGAPAVRAALLGALGRQFAVAHDGPHVAETVGRIRALPNAKSAGEEDSDDAKTAALADIGTALAENGQTDAALALAKTLKASGPKMRLQAEIAFALCHDGPTVQGAAVAKLAADALMHPAGGGAPVSGGPTFAAAAAAACQGQDAARAIIDTASQNPAMTRQAAVTLLANSGLRNIAAALAPAPDAGDPVALAEAARRRLDEGDRAEAHRLAAQAGQAAAKMHDQHEQIMALTAAFSVLTGVGAYDEALEAVKPMNLASQRGFSLNVVHTAIAAHDAAAVRRMVPKAMALMAKPTPFPNVPRNQMADMALMLAQGGYRAEAETVFKALTPPNDDDDDYFGARTAMAKAGLGDVDGAMKMAAESGELVTKQDAPAAAPGLDVQGSKPADGGIVYRPGPQAEALSAIAAEFANAGQIDAAKQAEAKLEVALPAPQGDALRDDRDSALAAIAKAQVKAGQPHEALATSLRIVSPGARFGALLALLDVPVKA